MASFGLDGKGFWQSADCAHPAAAIDTPMRKAEFLVTGIISRPTLQRPCTMFRSQADGCGELGRLWEPRR